VSANWQASAKNATQANFPLFDRNQPIGRGI